MLRGTHHTPEARLLLSRAATGNHHVRGKRWTLSPEVKAHMLLGRKPDSASTRRKKSESLKRQWAAGLRHGTPASPQHRLRMSAAVPHGSASKFWKGGLRDQNAAIRKSVEYKIWRAAVLARDDYRCYDCGSRGVRLHVDHILPFATYPRLRLDMHNARTLCVPCHRQTPTYLNRWSSKPNQVFTTV
jgi:hypothetical protein